MATTGTIEDACALIWVTWSSGFGKLTTSAIAVAATNTSASGRMSSPSRTSRATVSPRLNQISLGRSVGRFGSRPLTMSGASSPELPTGRSTSRSRTVVPALPGRGPVPATAGCRDAATFSRVRPDRISRFRSDRPMK